MAHVHIHVLPRKVGDFERNDDIYDLVSHKTILIVFQHFHSFVSLLFFICILWVIFFVVFNVW